MRELLKGVGLGMTIPRHRTCLMNWRQRQKRKKKEKRRKGRRLGQKQQRANLMNRMRRMRRGERRVAEHFGGTLFE